ncbi:MAG: hypothetical protein V4737_09545 [Curtobacterium sp.]
MTLAGCASSQGKTGPAATAITGTWTCKIDGKKGELYNSDGEDDRLSFYGGDEYTVDITRDRFTVTGNRDGKEVAVKGDWRRDERSTSSVTGIEVFADDAPNGLTIDFALPPTLTKREVRVERDPFGLVNGFDSDQATVVASASRITFEVDAADEYSGGKDYAIRCSR